MDVSGESQEIAKEDPANRAQPCWQPAIAHLSDGEVHRDEILALVNGGDVRARVLLANHRDPVGVPG